MYGVCAHLKDTIIQLSRIEKMFFPKLPFQFSANTEIGDKDPEGVKFK